MENSAFKSGMTHAGKFHADDVFASALLRVVYGKDFKISRVRTVPEDVADDVLVFDIGGGKYDHHQNGSAVRKDAESPLDGTPYASFGLLWQEYGPELVGDEQTRIFDERFVRTIDANDNGVLPEADTISLAVDSFMPNWDEAGSADDAFEAAVNWAQTVLERFIARMQSAVKAENIVQTAIEQADDPRIVVLDTFAPWVQPVCKAKEPQFIIFPSNRGGWSAQVVPTQPGSREMRIHFPEEWVKNKPQGVNFIHQARFLIATDSKEDAVRLCRQAIDEQS